MGVYGVDCSLKTSPGVSHVEENASALHERSTAKRDQLSSNNREGERYLTYFRIHGGVTGAFHCIRASTFQPSHHRDAHLCRLQKRILCGCFKPEYLCCDGRGL